MKIRNLKEQRIRSIAITASGNIPSGPLSHNFNPSPFPQSPVPLPPLSPRRQPKHRPGREALMRALARGQPQVLGLQRQRPARHREQHSGQVVQPYGRQPRVRYVDMNLNHPTIVASAVDLPTLAMPCARVVRMARAIVGSLVLVLWLRKSEMLRTRKSCMGVGEKVFLVGWRCQRAAPPLAVL
jgi:hypothetical protein